MTSSSSRTTFAEKLAFSLGRSKLVWSRTTGSHLTKLGREHGKFASDVKKIDTQVRHVTKPGANLFAELGFSPDDAKRYQAESRERIDHTLALKEQLMGELVSWIKDSHLKQGEAAEILHVTRPRVSDVVNKKASKFTIDALVDMLARIGKPVRVVIG